MLAWFVSCYGVQQCLYYLADPAGPAAAPAPVSSTRTAPFAFHHSTRIPSKLAREATEAASSTGKSSPPTASDTPDVDKAIEDLVDVQVEDDAMDFREQLGKLRSIASGKDGR